jgi:hypothetical protein
MRQCSSELWLHHLACLGFCTVRITAGLFLAFLFAHVAGLSAVRAGEERRSWIDSVRFGSIECVFRCRYDLWHGECR